MSFEFDLGFLGGGQLARMSIQAAQRMGLRCVSLDPEAESPAAQIAPSFTGRLNDIEMLAMVFASCAHVTLENEFVSGELIRTAMEATGRELKSLVPGISALETIQDKLRQRRALHAAKIPSPRAVPIDDDGSSAIAQIGFPMVIKTRFGGYDGKGTRTVRSRDELEDFRILWAGGGWLAEEFVEFTRELAVMAYRSESEEGCFPTMETVQENHVCSLVFPADVDGSKLALDAIRTLDGIGLYGVELFERTDGSLFVNEIAPRPHNTGHYTLDWGGVSQFEQHVRLALGMRPAVPDGDMASMANLLGLEGVGDYRDAIVGTLEEFSSVHVHWYGKAKSRPGRKMGHINATGSSSKELVLSARQKFYELWSKDADSDWP